MIDPKEIQKKFYKGLCYTEQDGKLYLVCRYGVLFLIPIESLEAEYQRQNKTGRQHQIHLPIRSHDPNEDLDLLWSLEGSSSPPPGQSERTEGTPNFFSSPEMG